jgi:hypothetical protein
MLVLLLTILEDSENFINKLIVDLDRNTTNFGLHFSVMAPLLRHGGVESTTT